MSSGLLLPQAKSLCGSWFDSGINILSIIGMLVSDISQLKLEEATMVKVPEYDYPVQNTAHFSLPFSGGKTTTVEMETSWCTGYNHKVTVVELSNGIRIVLHHSRQMVYRITEISGGRGIEILADFSAGQSRLVKHYLGLYRDFLQDFKTGKDNLDYALALHKILFEVADEGNKLEFP